MSLEVVALSWSQIDSRPNQADSDFAACRNSAVSYLGKGNKRTKLTEKIAGDFFSTERILFRIWSAHISSFHIQYYYFSQSISSIYAVKKAEVPSSYCVEWKAIYSDLATKKWKSIPCGTLFPGSRMELGGGQGSQDFFKIKKYICMHVITYICKYKYTCRYISFQGMWHRTFT